jgi:hypothetical protein
MTSELEGGEWLVARPSRTLPPGKDSVPNVQGGGWAPGPVWTDAENLAHTGIRSSDCSARSRSLYRLSYPAYSIIIIISSSSSSSSSSNIIIGNYK